jgi:predicted nucleic acid-binding protein
LNYWDSSALIKLYVNEADSQFFLGLAKTSQAPLLVSDISRQEILCTLYRKEQYGDLKAKSAHRIFDKFLSDEESGRLLMIPNGKDVAIMSESIVRQAYQQQPPLMLRSLDVIHISSALLAKATTMVTTDKCLRDIAIISGIKLLPK